MQLGQIVIAKVGTSVCRKGEQGVVYEIYQLDGRAGYSVIFAGGNYDGFSPQDVVNMLWVTEHVDEAVAAYVFRNAMQLTLDYVKGVFQAAHNKIVWKDVA